MELETARKGIGRYLVCVIELVVHESCDNAGLPNRLIPKEHLYTDKFSFLSSKDTWNAGLLRVSSATHQFVFCEG